jgi:hypothetical protein
MKKSLAVHVAAAAVLASSSTLALAAEGGPEGLGEMHGASALLMLLGGVTALGVVIWLMIKFLGRNG